MTIKKRLFLSNLMMIVVPVVIATVVGLGCMGLVLSKKWYKFWFG